MRHTQGDWRISIEPITQTDDRNLIIKMNEEVICLITKETHINDEERANAKLIAHAPAMLKRLILIAALSLDKYVWNLIEEATGQNWSMEQMDEEAKKIKKEMS